MKYSHEFSKNPGGTDKESPEFDMAIVIDSKLGVEKMFNVLHELYPNLGLAMVNGRKTPGFLDPPTPIGSTPRVYGSDGREIRNPERDPIIQRMIDSGTYTKEAADRVRVMNKEAAKYNR